MRFGLTSTFQLQKGLFSKPLSILICAKNESANLLEHLPIVCTQDYTEYEVIVVNDRSTDDSSIVLKQFQTKFPHLKVVTITEVSEDLKGKKNALAKGIQAASHPYLLMTDADCKPNSDQWALLMAQGFRYDKSIALGYGPYAKAPGFLNQFIRFETVLTAIQYFSWALWGLPYMGVGRNLAYKKELHHQSDGFKRHGDLASGDDDLFVGQVATRANVSIRIQPASFTYSRAAESWRALYAQKTRHYSTSTRYKPLVIAVLGLYSLTHFGIYLLGGVLLITGIGSVGLLCLFLGRLVVQWIVLYFCCTKLKERDLLSLVPVFDFIFVVYYLIFTPSLFLKPKKAVWRVSDG